MELPDNVKPVRVMLCKDCKYLDKRGVLGYCRFKKTMANDLDRACRKMESALASKAAVNVKSS